jgi:hypothetical protein
MDESGRALFFDSPMLLWTLSYRSGTGCTKEGVA